MPAYFGTIDVGTAWGAVEVDYPQQHVARRWEAAETNRLNEAHWQPVSDEINDALTADIKLLQQRCRHEANNNSVIDGGIETIHRSPLWKGWKSGLRGMFSSATNATTIHKSSKSRNSCSRFSL